VNRIPDAHFVDRYADSPDPWSLRGSWYEERKHALSVAALPRARYRSAFEPGCSVGLLTGLLAGRCDAVLAMDVSADAVRQTRQRCSAEAHVRVAQGAIPEAWPEGPFDLVVLSEVGYYLGHTALDAALDACEDTLSPDGHLLAVHFRPSSTEHLQTGDQVHRRLVARPRLHRLAAYRQRGFRLDVFAMSGD
jgi:SAM-dependent methyltransferase